MTIIQRFPKILDTIMKTGYQYTWYPVFGILLLIWILWFIYVSHKKHDATKLTLKFTLFLLLTTGIIMCSSMYAMVKISDDYNAMEIIQHNFPLDKARITLVMHTDRMNPRNNKGYIKLRDTNFKIATMTTPAYNKATVTGTNKSGEAFTYMLRYLFKIDAKDKVKINRFYVGVQSTEVDYEAYNGKYRAVVKAKKPHKLLLHNKKASD